MDKLLPFDELNTLRTTVTNIFEAGEGERKVYTAYIEDTLLDILVMSYVYGNEAANDMLGTEDEVEPSELRKSLGKKIAGEDWVERVSKYMEAGTVEDVMKVAETDAHRIYNEAIYNVAKREERKAETESLTSGKPVRQMYKTWQTMRDEKVRDTHAYLENMKIPFDERFFTYDGDSADHPGGFFTAENNVGCRCRLKLSW